MKKIFFLLITFLCAASVGAQPFAGAVDTYVRELQERDGLLRMAIEIEVDAKAMPKTHSWRITPELRTEEQSYDFPSILINGKNKRQMYERRKRFGSRSLEADKPFRVIDVHPRKNIKYEYAIELDYEPWMDDAHLVLEQILTSCCSEQQRFSVRIKDKVDLQIIEPYEMIPLLSYVIPVFEERKEREVSAQAYIDFKSGSSEIIADFRRNPDELGKINRTLSAITEDSDISVSAIFIEGFASPEGSFQSNYNLSGKRADALKRYITAHGRIGSGIIRSSAAGEDWRTLRRLVDESSMEYKADVLRIIDSGVGEDVMESRIKVIGGGRPYNIMVRDMYPALRRVDYLVKYDVRNYNLQEAREVIRRDASKLSLHEIHTVANSYPKGSHEYYFAYEQMLNQYPSDHAAIVNAAAAAIEQNDLMRASELLERTEDTAQKLNNMGVISLYRGDTAAAEVFFRRSVEKGSPEAAENITQLAKFIETEAARTRSRR